MNIFEQKNYRAFLRQWVESLPKKGHGQVTKLAGHLSVSTPYMSQVLGEKRELTSDQLYLACQFIGLSELETRYLVKLAQIERASHFAYKASLEKELLQIRQESKNISKRVQFERELTDQEKATFYSDWHFSAIRLLCSVRPQTTKDLARQTSLPVGLIDEVVHFLLSTELIIQEGDTYKMGTASTHVGADSPWVVAHHQNWRRKAIEHVKIKSPVKIHYTCPMTLSHQDALKIQGILLDAIQRLNTVVDSSNSEEELVCLNIDWFSFYGQDR